MRTEDLVAQLTSQARPVRRMAPPTVQALTWLAGAVLVLAVGVALGGVRPDLSDRMNLAHDVGQWTASVVLGVTSAFAAAMLARPDRSLRWAWLPVPAAVAWLSTLGMGCLDDSIRMGEHAFRMHESWSCLWFVTGFGLPLTAGLLLLLSHAGPVRPGPVLVTGALASCGLCSAALSLTHDLDAALMVLVWHGAGVVVVGLMVWLFGRNLLQPAPVVG